MPDRPNETAITLLGARHLQMLEVLAKREGRTPIEQLKWMILSRWVGRYKDLGDDRVDLRRREDEMTEVEVEVESLRLEGALGGFDNASRPSPVHPTPRPSGGS